MSERKSWFRRMAEAFRPLGDVADTLRPLEGSAAYPEPPRLVVPEDLKRAIDEENLKKARRKAREGKRD
ncbi:hypothetical protein [Nocardioides marmorisolisilvae]|uniref:Uncharacterized protein n=1 Tax=Nocardioides marmorisolisilvae TaxID=1542737 RepID=A0A3N0DS52_9ACTN|nr:hypothetical protein [Nocardioides marmorisolisilvae]RNL78465.1 hypothetical protein EFL95_05055 [Nocardioides marmorisolisilvae]